MKLNILFSLLIIIVFSFVGHSDYVNAPLEDVNSNNYQVAPSLLNYSSNMLSVNENNDFSGSNPIIWADLRLITVTNSINNILSDNDEHLIIWSWGQDHKSSISKSYPNSNGCPSTHVQLHENGEPYTCDLTFSFDYYNHSASIVYGDNMTISQFIPIPIDNDYYGELGLMINENSTDYIAPILHINLGGSICFPYVETKSYYLRTGNNTCQRTSSRTEKIITRAFDTELNYIIEFNDLSHLILTPILSEEHDNNPKFESVFFTNRHNAKLIYYLNDTIVASSYLKLFNITEDEFGVQYIQYYDTNETDLFSTDDDIIDPLLINHLVFSNYSNQLINPFQITDNNLSYSYSVNGRLNVVLLPTGINNYEIQYYDMFHQSWNYSKEVLIRKITLFHVIGDELLLIDGEGKPLTNKQIKLTNSSSEVYLMTNSVGIVTINPNSNLEILFEGDDHYRPCYIQLTKIETTQLDLVPFIGFGLIIGLLIAFGLVKLVV